MGMINGTSAGNVVSTGSLTIPLMKRVGYSKESAGAVEAAASTGGQIMPPIMGAGAFIMAEITGIPYTEIRSEEHTSELQSRPHLVCRLLLEKKKKKTQN